MKNEYSSDHSATIQDVEEQSVQLLCRLGGSGQAGQGNGGSFRRSMDLLFRLICQSKGMATPHNAGVWRADWADSSEDGDPKHRGDSNRIQSLTVYPEGIARDTQRGRDWPVLQVRFVWCTWRWSEWWVGIWGDGRRLDTMQRASIEDWYHRNPAQNSLVRMVARICEKFDIGVWKRLKECNLALRGPMTSLTRSCQKTMKSPAFNWGNPHKGRGLRNHVCEADCLLEPVFNRIETWAKSARHCVGRFLKGFKLATQSLVRRLPARGVCSAMLCYKTCPHLVVVFSPDSWKL